jgi:hypothetical protein
LTGQPEGNCRQDHIPEGADEVSGSAPFSRGGALARRDRDPGAGRTQARSTRGILMAEEFAFARKASGLVRGKEER